LKKCIQEAENKASYASMIPRSTDSSFDVVLKAESNDAGAAHEAANQAKKQSQQDFNNLLDDMRSQVSKATANEDEGLANITAQSYTHTDGDDATPEERAVGTATDEDSLTEEVEDEILIAADNEADLIASGGELLTLGGDAINTTNGTNRTNATADAECWVEKPGSAFVFVLVPCTASEAANASAVEEVIEWGDDVNGERAQDHEATKLMSAVASVGCVGATLIGGDESTYWGALGQDNVTKPCSPEGSETYLSPGGMEQQVAVELIREAERQRELEFAALMAAADNSTRALELR
jgi:hypothetical protein